VSRDARRQQEKQRLEDQRRGEENAVRITGRLANAPTVEFLMPQAYQMKILEWKVINEILEKD
jgi:hypothetical protein